MIAQEEDETIECSFKFHDHGKALIISIKSNDFLNREDVMHILSTMFEDIAGSFDPEQDFLKPAH